MDGRGSQKKRPRILALASPDLYKRRKPMRYVASATVLLEGTVMKKLVVTQYWLSVMRSVHEHCIHVIDDHECSLFLTVRPLTLRGCYEKGRKIPSAGRTYGYFQYRAHI